jgi:hypothetical protein
LKTNPQVRFLLLTQKTTENNTIKEIITHLLDEIKAVLKEYAEKQEASLKKRLKRLLIFSITGAVLMSVGISMAGAASLFFLIGSLRYLETFLPAWQAWFIIAGSSAVTAAALFVGLYLVIRSQLSSAKTGTQETTT